MENSVKLYSFSYSEAKTYLWATVFVACNMLLPQLYHLIPQGGIIFAPLSFVILAGAYKFGWKVGLLAAVLSPLVNHFVFGQPQTGMLLVMTVKLAVLAIVAGLAAQHFKSVSLPLMIGVVLVSSVIGGLGELVLTGAIDGTIADFTIGWPGLLLQVFGSWFILKKIG